ncbi:tripartite tricarboxylate transporter substrate binding protein [Vineibacter terrae]|uniref:Bug family tripartite tricarboxylate transporter substrate binding protein n=1 Tax=Vineibacter terrae TaxID=2586908 RepID=UPI002E328225|nr:tripartite tricarboxylate transporter substrate binding protein [Vineibacter terrae]HEX2884951.1 tripartite tricarboxylate transporter substrate binding protein [Vineibacter terrae]
MPAATGGKVRQIFTAALRGILVMAAITAFTDLRAVAQSFPSQPIKLVVPAAPGGSTDILARSMAQLIQQQTGVSVVVDNRAGAGGTIGVGAVVHAPPDGHTLLVTVPDGITVLPHLRKDIPYRAAQDLMPIGLMAETSWLFAVNAGSPFKTMKDLIAAAAAKPGSIRYSSPGIGTSAHLVTERLRLQSNTDMLHVPYKGAGPATMAVVMGEVDMIATSPISLKAFLDGGKIRGLAITGGRRSAVLPDIPTMEESGFAGFVASAWFGVFAPAGLSADRAEQVDRIVSAAVRHPDFQKQILAMGLDPRLMNRTEFAAYVAADSTRWREVVEKSKVSLSD